MCDLEEHYIYDLKPNKVWEYSQVFARICVLWAIMTSGSYHKKHTYKPNIKVKKKKYMESGGSMKIIIIICT